MFEKSDEKNFKLLDNPQLSASVTRKHLLKGKEITKIQKQALLYDSVDQYLQLPALPTSVMSPAWVLTLLL